MKNEEKNVTSKQNKEQEKTKADKKTLRKEKLAWDKLDNTACKIGILNIGRGYLGDTLGVNVLGVNVLAKGQSC